MRKSRITTHRPDAPDEHRFEDTSADLRRGLARELVADLDAEAMLKLATRRAIGLRTCALPDRLRALLLGGEGA
ncbi:MAG: hypothetical protein L6Q84_23545 [Polyangiaceae bacterium]|nr:hypothetical protein [Polyangiaceae bacterium]